MNKYIKIFLAFLIAISSAEPASAQEMVKVFTYNAKREATTIS